MCDYSLEHLASRPAAVGDKLVTTKFGQSFTRGFKNEQQSIRTHSPDRHFEPGYRAGNERLVEGAYAGPQRTGVRGGIEHRTCLEVPLTANSSVCLLLQPNSKGLESMSSCPQHLPLSGLALVVFPLCFRSVPTPSKPVSYRPSSVPEATSPGWQRCRGGIAVPD
jgi:hypothetical protein